LFIFSAHFWKRCTEMCN